MKLLKTPRFRAYLGLAVVAAGLVGLAVSGDLLVHAARFTAFYVLAGAGFALLATAATSLPLRGAVVAAVILRLVFLPVTPSLSTDYHRYVWDGRVQQAGVNPYTYRPYEHALDRVRYSGRALINHEELRSIYPPLTQALFLGVAEVSRGIGRGVAGEPAGTSPIRADRVAGDAPQPRAEVILFKLAFGAFDLATAGAVWLLATKKLRTRATVLYLLCPAVIVQTWESAHAEAPAMLFCVLAAALLVRRRDGWAGVALGLAAALKVTPLGLLVPALLGGRASPARFLAGFVPAFVIPYAPYLLTGGSFGSLFESGTGWTGGSLLFSLLAMVTTREAARWLSLAVFVGGAVWIAGSFRGREKTAEAFAWTSTLLILCLPVVHAWYWLTPLALGLAAGLWLPLLIGMAGPLVESLPLAAKLARGGIVALPGPRHTEPMQKRTTQMSGRTVVVMARPLVRGAVKTRLATALGDHGALAVYERLLRGTLEAAEQVPRAQLVLAEAPGAAARHAATSGDPAGQPATDALEGRGRRWRRTSQRGDGLGERLARVFAEQFAGDAASVIVVSSDSPALPPEYLEQAFAELASADVVLGPAADGGYYLIGASRRTWRPIGRPSPTCWPPRP